MRQWLSIMRFWMVLSSECTSPSTVRTSQIRPACEAMLRRTSWASSFIRLEMRPRRWKAVPSRPITLATGPSTWDSAARTGTEVPGKSAWSCGTRCCSSGPVQNSPPRGLGSFRHRSMTCTASLRTSCSLSFMSWMSGPMRWAVVISGPSAEINWSKFFATVRRTRHERSSAASSMTEIVCVLFSSGLHFWAITRVAWTHETRIVSWVSSWESCL
mmetsp:Transcript_72602/g.202662  ORF Transcript_72602/g.202662 Transcript_72602/m.202662 type:complete len:215 (-) Transcript_72602:709-1353(-)